jgi:predicted GNAT family acetyltransferase
VNVILTRSAQQLAERAAGLLESRIEHNVLATVLDAASAHAHVNDLFAIVEDEHGAVIGAAMRVGGRRLLASGMDEASAASLIETWLPADPGVPGVAGPTKVARAAARAWEQITRGRSALAMAMALHTLDRVQGPARPASGAIRPAAAADRDRLIEWMGDFAREAGIEDDPVHMVDRRPLYVWEDGEPVSVVGLNPAVAGVARIGPVYTPPVARGRGYASSAVAAVSRSALAAGARQCILYTDLANPGSNRIYAALGYRRVADWEERSFIAQ